MNTLKSLFAAAVLTFTFTVSVAGETVCNPGETHSPPCPSTLVVADEPVGAPGATSPLPEAQSLEIVSLVEFALYALLLA